MSSFSEKRAVRKAEKRIEREEAEAGFKLNKIKPVTNGQIGRASCRERV